MEDFKLLSIFRFYTVIARSLKIVKWLKLARGNETWEYGADSLEKIAYLDNASIDSALLHKITSSSDFKFVSAHPVSVERKKEMEQIKIHYDPVLNAGFENWGFESTLKKLGASERENIQFIGFKGAGYSAKLYFEEVPEKVIGLIVSRRPSASPAIDQSGKAL